jgi:hypothetical protein
MKRKLVALLKWLLQVLEPPESDELRDRAIVLVRQFESVPQSGEFKRHQVYAQLLKEFPSVAKHKVSLAIEQAISQERD